MLSETLKIMRQQRKAVLKDIAHLLNNMIIISDEKPSDKLFTNLSLEQKALLKFLENSKSSGGEQNPVVELIERGRATEHLLRVIVKRRDKNLFDESNTEEQNVWLLNLLEKVFPTEAQITQFLDHPNEQYCSYLSQYLATMKSQLTALPDYAKLH